MQRIYARTRAAKLFLFYKNSVLGGGPPTSLDPSPFVPLWVVFLSRVTLRPRSDVLHMVTVIAVHFSWRFVKNPLVLIYLELSGAVRRRRNNRISSLYLLRFIFSQKESWRKIGNIAFHFLALISTRMRTWF